jgi:hypothetical protein
MNISNFFSSKVLQSSDACLLIRNEAFLVKNSSFSPFFFKHFSSTDKKRIVSWIQNHVPSQATTNKFIDRGIFALGVGLVALNIDSMIREQKGYLKEKRKSQAIPGMSQSLAEAKRKMILEGVSLVGTSAMTIDWGHEAQLLSLGQARVPIQGVSKTATFFVSGVKTVQAFQCLKEGFEKFNRRLPEAFTKTFIEKNRLALLDIIAYSTSSFWVILELASLILGTALFSIVSNILIVLSIGFGIGSIFYKHHLDKTKNK